MSMNDPYLRQEPPDVEQGLDEDVDAEGNPNEEAGPDEEVAPLE